MTHDERAATMVWNNGAIPVILRRGGGQPVRLRVPFSNDNRKWLKDGPRKKEPEWNKKDRYWELPSSRFNEIVKMVLDRYDQIYIIQPYREKEVCARACMEAEGFECQCSCMGANHGSSNQSGWFEVSETFAVRYGERILACRLLKKDETQPQD